MQTKHPKYKGYSSSKAYSLKMPKELKIQLIDEAEIAERKLHNYVLWKLSKKI